MQNLSWPGWQRTPILFVDAEPSRLCAKPMPYGFADRLPASSCAKAVKKKQDKSLGLGGPLPPIAPPNVLMFVDGHRNCAVVGNGGLLFGSGAGRAVDAHDHVIRINAAPTGGPWAADVGSKSSLRILTDWTGQMKTTHPTRDT